MRSGRIQRRQRPNRLPSRPPKANFCSDLISVESMTYLELGSFVRNGQLSPKIGLESMSCTNLAAVRGANKN